MFVEKLPVPILPAENQVVFENIINEIMILKNENIPYQDLETQIDEKIYELYGLEQSEIQFIGCQ